MQHLCFLYKSNEEGSLRLRNALDDEAIRHGVRVWSDMHATDPGFVTELRTQLRQSDVIVHCVGPKGIGLYQGVNEIDETIDALRLRGDRRLVVLLIDGADAPPGFARFDEFAGRRSLLRLDSAAADPGVVLHGVFPDASCRPGNPEGDHVAEILGKTLNATRNPKWLTIVVGPYAAAEVSASSGTPQQVASWLLKDRGLPGRAPWLDVLGSVARATFKDDDDAAMLVEKALSSTAAEAGALETYLRLLAANWARRTTSASRLVIVACTPDRQLDLALRSAGMPVPHLRLVHCPQRAREKEELSDCPQKESGLFAQRIEVPNPGTAKATPLDSPLEPLEDRDRVILVKPFGCFEDLASLLITAEHWRENGSKPMPLPLGMVKDMARSVVVTLGAGAFAPSVQLVFRSLLRDALSKVEKHDYRYLVHDRRNAVQDDLHELERALAEQTGKHHATYETWLKDTYDLKLHRLELLTLLANFDHQLNRVVA